MVSGGNVLIVSIGVMMLAGYVSNIAFLGHNE